LAGAKESQEEMAIESLLWIQSFLYIPSLGLIRPFSKSQKSLELLKATHLYTAQYVACFVTPSTSTSTAPKVSCNKQGESIVPPGRPVLPQVTMSSLLVYIGKATRHCMSFQIFLVATLCFH
jgi:hypothetical protein